MSAQRKIAPIQLGGLVVDLLFSFKGRIGRGQFWLGVLVTFLLTLGAGIVLEALEPARELADTGFPSPKKAAPSIPQVVLVLAYLVLSGWISIAVAVKRFHDLGRSGWWYLIVLIPFVGSLLVLIWLGALPGDEGPNTYGPPIVAA